MVRIFILEDDNCRIRQFHANFKNAELTITDSSKEAIKILKKEKRFDYIFLDHDLGGKQMVDSGENTGFEVAQWLFQHPKKKPKFNLYVHSLNPAGRKNILGELGYGQAVPFVWSKKLKF